MTTRSAVALIAVAVIATACTESTSPTEMYEPSFAAGGRPYTPGEQHPIVDLTRGTWAIYPTGHGQIVAQTFTPQSNQWLGYLELPVSCAEDVLLNVKVRDGLSGAILFEGNVQGLPTSVDGTFQLIQVFDPRFSHGVRLRKDHEYAIELAAFPGPDATEDQCAIARGPAGDAYARGRAYYQDPLNGPLFRPLPNGNPGDQEDLPFITLVR